MTPGQIASYKAARAFYSSPSVEQRQRDTELRLYQVLGSLMQRVPLTTSVTTWSVQGHTIDIMVGGYRLSGHTVRGKLMLLAEQFNLEYAERDHSSAENMIVAFGQYEDVPVRFWRTVPPCNCKTCEAGR